MKEYQFDPKDTKYYCCYGCCVCHVMTCAKTLTNIFTILAVMNLAVSFVVLYVGWAAGWGTSAGGVAFISLVSFVILRFLSYGLHKEREGFLIPFLIFVIIGLILAFIGTIYTFAVLIAFTSKSVSKSQAGQSEHLTLLFFAGLLALTLIGLNCWIFYVFKRAYSYIKEKRLADETFSDESFEEMNVMAPKDDLDPLICNDELATCVITTEIASDKAVN